MDCPLLRTGTSIEAPATTSARGVPMHTRRRFTGGALGAALLAAAGPLAAETMPECKRSGFTKAVSAQTVEEQALQQYHQMLEKAETDRALVPASHPQVQRLRYIADRIIPFTRDCNSRAAEWKWEINLIGSRQVNAFCMSGGKIAFFWGILAEMQLSDDEVAMVMGHEIAHALLEHAREQMGKNVVTSGAMRLGAALLGLGQIGDLGAQVGSHLMALKYSRDDEAQADALGLVLAARAGYDPRAGVTLWQKMSTGGGAPPAILSTHPTGPERIQEIEARLPRAMPVYEAAAKPTRHFAPPPRGSTSRS